MASCNYRSIHDPVRSTPSYIRQSLSAVRVISILSSESPEYLPPLPIIPYALSLAMSVAYRQFRQSKLQVHKNRAKEDLNTCCVLLNRLRTAWWSAGAMADLGTAALAKADKASRTKITKRTSAPASAHQPGADPGLGRNERASGADNHLLSSGDQRHQALQTSGDLGGLDVDHMPAIPSQHPTSSTRAELSPLGSFDFTESPDWLNFDNAFENFDTLLGSSGADISSELLKPFSYGAFDFLDLPT
ncbi:hypothetical protein H2199_000257 [Coniosporium tulheliwenetii]|uniref:Uncharacterized protein n=1 Tax=Coniosporium tulheliwenetii TaxID=3383036 RepID=A0ACC2ZPN1_9PEZI|nr:hypothetical protein H2199_000257 [Cladosporium sp. JES 115]